MSVGHVESDITIFISGIKAELFDQLDCLFLAIKRASAADKRIVWILQINGSFRLQRTCRKIDLALLSIINVKFNRKRSSRPRNIGIKPRRNRNLDVVRFWLNISGFGNGRTILLHNPLIHVIHFPNHQNDAESNNMFAYHAEFLIRRARTERLDPSPRLQMELHLHVPSGTLRDESANL